MSDTPIDFAKITQAIDNGWVLSVYRNGTYEASAYHENPKAISRANNRLIASCPKETKEIFASSLDENQIVTDDFTPEQALTRLAYKVLGEVI